MTDTNELNWQRTNSENVEMFVKLS